jgi:pantoate--beta-alanine ligase
MGALHEGHASLIRHARSLASPNGRVLSSIFVNPTQFGPSEDFTKYPRTVDADVQILTANGCDAVFVPSAAEMYPQSPTASASTQDTLTTVDPGPLANILEGAIRPGHFRGVCTVVLKLLNITTPTHLLLGQKDFQQQAVLRRMCQDLNLPVEVVTSETIREPDGLAMSSRNRYLSPEDRPKAAAIHQALALAKQSVTNGERNPRTLEQLAKSHIESAGLIVQYVTTAHAHTLNPFNQSPIHPSTVMLIAAKLGTTRLIDNMLLTDNNA